MVIVNVVNTIKQRDYTDEGHEKRLKFVGKVGTVVARHDSHGLCYDVAFDGGDIATYDPVELNLVEFLRTHRC